MIDLIKYESDDNASFEGNEEQATQAIRTEEEEVFERCMTEIF